MELNREQIIKALECCIEGECDACKYDEQTACKEYLLNDALALIKELTEENERLKELGTIKEVEKEIVRRQTEANTVRNMQERLKKRCPTNLMWLGGRDNMTFDEFVDSIAKEMLR